MPPIQHRDPDDIRDIPGPGPHLLTFIELVLAISAALSSLYILQKFLEAMR